MSRQNFINTVKLVRKHYLFILLLILTVILRFVWLDKVPNGITGDELDYIFTAKAISLTGHDVTGEWEPLSVLTFKYPPTEFPRAELPYLLFIPIVKLTKFSLLTARLLYATVSVLTVVVLYLISIKLLGKSAAIATAFIAAINPWYIFIGRTSYESPLAVFFFLLALYILLVTKGWKILISLPVLFLAFYSYIGTKLVFLPFVIAIILFSYKYVNAKKYLRQYLIVFFLSSFLVILFVYRLESATTSRISELFSINSPKITLTVDNARRASIHTPFTNYFDNKITVAARIIIAKFLRIFSTDYLFLYGDKFYAIFQHGLFYYIDIVFLYIGSAYLFMKQRKIFLFFLSLIFLGTLPQVFQGVYTDNMAAHISLVFPFLIIFIGSGIAYLLSLLKNKYIYYLGFLSIIGVYLLLLVNFINIYVFQHSLKGYFDFPKRVLSRYVYLTKERGQNIYILSHNPSDILRKYLLYTNSYNKDNALKIGKKYKVGVYELENLKFTTCGAKIDFADKTNLIIADNMCEEVIKQNLEHVSISRLSDAGEIFRIYNDQMCKKYRLKRYPNNINLSDFNIEQLSEKHFCETFINML